MRAVLFDLDDTLFDHSHSSREAIGALVENEPRLRGRQIDELRRLYSVALENAHARLVAGELTLDEARIIRFQEFFEAAASTRLSREQAAAFAIQYRRHYETTWRPVPGARELLTALKTHVRIGVVSNNLVAEQVAKLRACGLDSQVDELVVSEEAGCAKPAVRIFEIALDRLGCRAGDAVMVGDNWPNDVGGAHAAGIRAVWFNRDGRLRPDETPADEIAAFEPVEAVCQRLLGG
jgi:putative hydrolase of the HAD superfamily